MSGTVAFYTLGCKLNFTETSTIGRQMVAAGFQKVAFTDAADLYVINTCSVTDHADRKCKKVVREALRYNPNAYVVIVGCYAQLKPAEIASIPGVDLVLGAAEKFQLPMHLKALVKETKPKVFNSAIKETNVFIPGFSEGDRTRTFVKVQDGCDYFCSFCTIPLARGSSRSASIADTVKRVREISKNGIGEVILTGVNLGDFGVTSGEDFLGLVKELDTINTVSRYRISSIEPNLLSEEIIRFVADSEKFVPHFHIPLQSGHDEILQRMRRRYDSTLYASRIDLIKSVIPDCAIGVDVITGFPGETDASFETTYRFINELDVTYLHVFPYSERPNTTARKMKEKVPVKIRHERGEMLRILSEKKRAAFYRNYIGKIRPVLFEHENDGGKMFGFTDNYIRVSADYDPLLVNEITPVEIADPADDGSMQCHFLPEALLQH